MPAKLGVTFLLVGFILVGVGHVWLGASTLAEASCLVSATGPGCLPAAFNGSGYANVVSGVGFFLVGGGFFLTLYAALSRIEGVPRIF